MELEENKELARYKNRKSLEIAVDHELDRVKFYLENKSIEICRKKWYPINSKSKKECRYYI